MVNDEEQRAIAAGPSREPGAAYEAIDPRPVRRWLLEEAPRLGYSVSEISAAEFDDRYLDTPDWRFHRAGLSLRVRTVADGQLVESRVLPRAHARGVELTGARTYLEGNGVPDLKNCEGLLGERVRSLVGHETLDGVVGYQGQGNILCGDGSGYDCDIVDRVGLVAKGHPGDTIGVGRYEEIKGPISSAGCLEMECAFSGDLRIRNGI